MADIKGKWAITTGLGIIAAGMWLVGVGLPYLAPLPIFLSGAIFGLNHAAIASIVGAVVISLIAPWSGTKFVLILALPGLLLVRQALLHRIEPDGIVHWYPTDRLIGWLAAIASLAFLVAVLLTLDAEDGLPGFIAESFLQPALDLLPEESRDQITSNELIAFVSHIIPAAFATIWMAVTVINGILAQSIADHRHVNIRPDVHLGVDGMPRWIGAALLITAFGSFVFEGYGEFICETLVVIFAFPFFLQGMSLVHRKLSLLRGKNFILAVIYLGATMMYGLVAIPVILLGLLEQWAGWRQKMAPASQS